MWYDRTYYVRCLSKDLELDIITHWRDKNFDDWEPWIFDLANGDVYHIPRWWCAI